MNGQSSVPCEHDGAWIGTVDAGDIHGGAYCSAITCAECVTITQGYVQMRTGQPARELLTFVDARNGVTR